MKHAVIWLVVAVASYAGLAGGYHAWLQTHPRRIVVVVDSSNAMQGMLPRVDAILDDLARRRYHEFALYTDRSRMHGWSRRFSPGRIAAYGPRDPARFEALRSRPEFAEADEVFLITNAPPDELAGPNGWTVRRLE